MSISAADAAPDIVITEEDEGGIYNRVMMTWDIDCLTKAIGISAKEMWKDQFLDESRGV